jgi:transcriptional regulator with XRE-family HTH domain
MDARGVVEFLKIRLEQAGLKTNEQAAEAIGINQNHVSQILNGRSRPGPKVLKWLGLRRVFAYEHVGITGKGEP